MRQGEKGNFITLEEDIQRIWSLHGLVVKQEEVSSHRLLSSDETTWIIKAKSAKVKKK